MTFDQLPMPPALAAALSARGYGTATGVQAAVLDPAVVERMGIARAKRLGEVGARGGGTDSSPRVGTPAPFRDLLLSIAQTARPSRQEAA